MGERLLCKQEVIGSIPFTSTIGHPPAIGDDAPVAARRSEKRDETPARACPGAGC